MLLRFACGYAESGSCFADVDGVKCTAWVLPTIYLRVIPAAHWSAFYPWQHQVSQRQYFISEAPCKDKLKHFEPPAD